MPDKKQAEPAFVYEDEFEDHEWREAAATSERDRTKAQKRMAAGQPRLHPYGAKAFRDTDADGRVRWFPDKEARNTYVAANQADEGMPKAMPSPSEGGGPEQVKAARVGLESEEKVQGRDGRGKTRGS